LSQRRAVFEAMRLAARTFAAWKNRAGVSGTDKWSSKGNAWNNCCGNTRPNIKYCLGHNYSHIARCGMCRQGDPCKPLKKVRGHQKRVVWNDILQEAKSFEASRGLSELEPFFAGKKVAGSDRRQYDDKNRKTEKAPEGPSSRELGAWTFVDTEPVPDGSSSRELGAWTLVDTETVPGVSENVVVDPPASYNRRCTSGCPCMSRRSRKQPVKSRFLWA
jgi:hypothetical protein